MCAAASDRLRVEAACADLTWVGRVLAGAGARFLDAGGSRTLAGYEHRLG